MSNYDLYHYCRRNLVNEVLNILEKTANLDILYEEGSFLIFAVSKDNYEIFSALLKYFYEVQLPRQYNEHNRIAQANKLKEFIQEAFEMYSPSDEMQKITESYGIDLSKDDVGSVRSNIEDINSMLNDIKKIEVNYHNSSQDHLSTNNSPYQEEDWAIINRKYEETSEWEFNQLKSDLIVNKYEDYTVVALGDSNSTIHHSD